MSEESLTSFNNCLKTEQHSESDKLIHLILCVRFFFMSLTCHGCTLNNFINLLFYLRLTINFFKNLFLILGK